MNLSYQQQPHRIAIIFGSILLLLIVFGWKHKIAIQTITEMVNEKVSIHSIYTMDDYMAFVDSVNAGNTYDQEYVNLYTDLDFDGVTENIVIGSKGSPNNLFQGVFDGHGHKLFHVVIESEESESAGLFGNLDGTVCNLEIKSGSIVGANCGAFAAETTLSACILNCCSYAEIYGDTYNGLQGNWKGVVKNCYAPSFLEDIDSLNQGLCGLGGISKVNDWHFWELLDGSPSLSERTADTLTAMYADVKIDKENIRLYAYYSVLDKTWCFPLPSGYEDVPLDIILLFSNGNTQYLSRNRNQAELICEEDSIYYPIKFLTDDRMPSLFIQTDTKNAVDYLNANKEHKLNGDFILLDGEGCISDYGKVDKISGHGNDSWKAQKKSYNLTLHENVDLLDMGASKKYVLLAGYRDNSLLTYKITNDLAREIGMAYAPKTDFINLYVDGNYLGMYFLTGRIEIGENRFALKNLEEDTTKLNRQPLKNYERHEWDSDTTHAKRIWFDLEREPEDISGGYIIEMDKENYDDVKSRFVSERNLSMVMRSMPYASYDQVNYIADYWQDFENAIYSEDGWNDKGKYYADYIDMESFADQWLFYELNEENSLGSSVYFYKDSDLYGDGLLHASYLWDVEHSLTRGGYATWSWLATTKNGSDEYWNQFYRHKDFAELVYNEWMEKFLPALEKALQHEKTENSEGISPLDWYLERYGSAGSLNYSRWEDCPYEEKLEKIRTIFTARKDFLTKALSLYDSDYDYFYEENGNLYGCLSSGEIEKITWYNEKDK